MKLNAKIFAAVAGLVAVATCVGTGFALWSFDKNQVQTEKEVNVSVEKYVGGMNIESQGIKIVFGETIQLVDKDNKAVTWSYDYGDYDAPKNEDGTFNVVAQISVSNLKFSALFDATKGVLNKDTPVQVNMTQDATNPKVFHGTLATDGLFYYADKYDPSLSGEGYAGEQAFNEYYDNNIKDTNFTDQNPFFTLSIELVAASKPNL